MRRLLLGLGLAITALAMRRSSSHQAEAATDDDPAEIDLTDHASTARGPAEPQAGMPESHAGMPETHGAQGARGHRADRPTEIPKAGWLDIAKRTLAEVKEDQVPMMAAAVAFAGLLALFPAMIAGISIFGLVADAQTVAEQSEQIAEALPEAAASLITDQLGDIAGSEASALGVALIVSILGALWSASGGMGMLIKALNVAYDEDDDRGFLRRRGLAIVLTVGAIVFVLMTVGLIAVVPPILEELGLGTAGVIAAQAARWALLALLIAMALAVLYRFAPNREDARWAWISPGAVVAGALWLIGSVGFSLFVSNFGSYNETYGAVSGVIVLMLWLQISAMAVLLGAEINAEMEHQTRHDTTTGPARPMGQRGAVPADSPPPAPGQPANEPVTTSH